MLKEVSLERIQELDGDITIKVGEVQSVKLDCRLVIFISLPPLAFVLVEPNSGK
jgi:hypothetical protein